MKITKVKLKIAQINSDALLQIDPEILAYCRDNPAFMTYDDDILCHSSIFDSLIENYKLVGEKIPKGLTKTCTELTREFINYDYIMII